MYLRMSSLERIFSRLRVFSALALCLGLLLSTRVASADVPGQLTDHFQAWLDANGYAEYGFERSDMAGGSFGGKSWIAPTVDREPVIFVHGASDRALGGTAGGWTLPLQAYAASGYKGSELYATTYGYGTPAEVTLIVNSADNLDYLASFIESVLEYTGKQKVNIVAHSFGVTLARGAIRSHNLGSRVRTFIAIAGTNRGAPGCMTMFGLTPLCNLLDGVSPYSSYISYINGQVGYEGQYRYSIWSGTDEIVGYNCAIAPWVFTCSLPGQTGQLLLNGWTHLALRDYTGQSQVNLIMSAYP
jgi:triacylglycerol lipase